MSLNMQCGVVWVRCRGELGKSPEHFLGGITLQFRFRKCVSLDSNITLVFTL